MAQLGNDSFAAGAALMPLEEAAELLLARVPCVEGTEEIPLAEAVGRVLAKPVLAPIDLPPFDNSAVDGYAVRFQDLAVNVETTLAVSGRVAAGQSSPAAKTDCKAVRIFTGAPIPEGMDTVFMQEDCRVLSDGSVVFPAGLAKGANRRLRGEDIRCGDAALQNGRLLQPEDLGLAAALGLASLVVRRRLRAAIFSTGNEIVSPGEPLRSAAVYDANRFILHGLLRRLGVEVTDLGILADDQQIIAAALHAAARTHDLVLTSGGVSVGEEDHVKAAVAQHGSLVFWRLAIKPGRPAAMGVIEGTPFVGLPGNPVAAFVTFAYVVRPLVAALSGSLFEPVRPLSVVSGFAYEKKAGRREYVRVSLRGNAADHMIAEKYPVEGSGVLTSLTRTHGFVELPEAVTVVTPGEKVAYIDYRLIR